MSEVRWCDTGNHAFAYGRDADERTLRDTRERDGVREQIDICGPCHRKSVAKVTLAITTVEATTD